MNLLFTNSQQNARQAEVQLIIERMFHQTEMYNYKWAAVNLTLKQGRMRNNGTLQSLSVEEVRRGIKRVLKALNLEAFGKAFRRHDRRLIVLPVIETSANGRLHIHMLVHVREAYENVDAFARLEEVVRKTWETYPWGWEQAVIRRIDSHQEAVTFARYILKDVIKGVSDVVDYSNMVTAWEYFQARDAAHAARVRADKFIRLAAAKKRAAREVTTKPVVTLRHNTTVNLTEFETD